MNAEPTLTNAQPDRRTFRFMERVARHAQEAVGLPFAVRTGRNSSVRGVVSRVTGITYRNRGLSTVAQFTLFLKGPNGVEHGPFKVERLPR